MFLSAIRQGKETKKSSIGDNRDNPVKVNDAKAVVDGPVNHFTIDARKQYGEVTGLLLSIDMLDDTGAHPGHTGAGDIDVSQGECGCCNVVKAPLRRCAAAVVY